MKSTKNALGGLFILAISLCLVHVAGGQEMKAGEINWVKGYVSAVGNGTADPSGNKVKDRLKALRAAELVAQRTLLETLKGVQIDSRTTVENLMLKEDVINSRVEGVIRGAQIARRDVAWEENVPLATVEMRICLSNGVGGCNMDSSLVTVLNITPKSEPPYAPPERLAVQETPAEPAPKTETQATKKTIQYDSSKPVTGAVFNLSDQPFTRQLLPVIISMADEKKPLTVYSVKNVAPKIIRTYGVVRYADSEEQAKQNPYIGNNVIVIPVEDITKDNMIVVTPEAARIIRETMMNGNNYLSDAKVVICTR